MAHEHFHVHGARRGCPAFRDRESTLPLPLPLPLLAAHNQQRVGTKRAPACRAATERRLPGSHLSWRPAGEQARELWEEFNRTGHATKPL